MWGKEDEKIKHQQTLSVEGARSKVMVLIADRKRFLLLLVDGALSKKE